MPEKSGQYPENSKTSIIAVVVIGLFVVVGLCAMIFSSHNDLFDDAVDAAVDFGKIAVACDGKNLNSYVSPVFSRAKYFLIVDPESGDYKAIRNPFRNLNGAVGVRVAQLIAKEIDDGVITGDIGPNAYNILTGSGFNVYNGYTGNAGKAVESYKRGKIAAAQNSQYQGSNIANVMDYFHCQNCNTVVPCPYGHNGAGGNCPPCPSCGLRMGFIPGITAQNTFAAGGFGQGPGAGGYLVCPGCGNTVMHQNGVPAYGVNCPQCGTAMCRQSPALIPTAFYNNQTTNRLSNVRSQTAPPITANAFAPHGKRGVCTNCHQITTFNNQSGTYGGQTSIYNNQASTYGSGGFYNNNGARPYRIGPGGCIIR